MGSVSSSYGVHSINHRNWVCTSKRRLQDEVILFIVLDLGARLTRRAGGCAGTAIDTWLRDAWVGWWCRNQQFATSAGVLWWAFALEGVANDQAETTVQAWIGFTNTLFTSETVESRRANASEEVRCSNLTGTTVLTWVVVTWVGSSQVDFTADTAEANGARATE